MRWLTAILARMGRRPPPGRFRLRPLNRPGGEDGRASSGRWRHLVTAKRRPAREAWRGNRHAMPGRQVPDRRRQPRWRRNARRMGFILIGFFLIAFLPTWALRTGWVERQFAGLGHMVDGVGGWIGLRVDEVLVVGRARTTGDEILRAMGAARGRPILSIDPHAARVRLMALPWVEQAVVERRLPDTLYVEIAEREPLALWQAHGRIVLIDPKGAEIPVGDLSGYRNLLLVVGEDAPMHAAALVALLETEPRLAERVRAAVRIGGRRWNLRMDNGIDLRLPETDVTGVWRRFARLQRRHDLLGRAVAVIDLRLPDRMILRMIEEPNGSAPATAEIPPNER